MDETFNPQEFLDKLISGHFDGRVHEEIHKLSYEQLEAVALLLARNARGKGAASE